jgi:pimeloyl-ACP methyl ester carboxylesterase
MQRRAFDVQLNTDDAEVDVPEYDVASIDLPTLVVSGAHDLDALQTCAADLAATMPNARHLHLDWAGHLPSLERPAEITRLLLDEL